VASCKFQLTIGCTLHLGSRYQLRCSHQNSDSWLIPGGNLAVTLHFRLEIRTFGILQDTCGPIGGVLRLLKPASRIAWVDGFIPIQNVYVRYVQTYTNPTKAIYQAIERLAFYRFGHLGDHSRTSKTTWKYFSHHFVTSSSHGVTNNSVY
jgi:hypothetical protein